MLDCLEHLQLGHPTTARVSRRRKYACSPILLIHLLANPTKAARYTRLASAYLHWPPHQDARSFGPELTHCVALHSDTRLHKGRRRCGPLLSSSPRPGRICCETPAASHVRITQPGVELRAHPPVDVSLSGCSCVLPLSLPLSSLSSPLSLQSLSPSLPSPRPSLC